MRFIIHTVYKCIQILILYILSNIFNHLIFGGVGLGRVGGGLVVLGLLGVTFVLDVSDEAVAIILVGDGLDATIGEGDAVGARDDLSVVALLVTHVDVRVVVLNVIRVGVGAGRLLI